MTKKELAAKVAKEQGLDVNKLMRLTVAELEKMDLVVEDELEAELAEETEDEFDAAIEEEIEAHQEADQVVDQAESNVERRLLGHHPITGEAVYL